MSLFLIGGTNVMLCYWWHKCHILTIGGTNVAVGEMSWWDKCQVGQMSVGQMSVGQKSRHQSVQYQKHILCPFSDNCLNEDLQVNDTIVLAISSQ
jgi:hypothetical protein